MCLRWYGKRTVCIPGERYGGRADAEIYGSRISSGDSYPHDEFGNGSAGDRESYSTLDFMDLDLYSGQMTITKIGAAASFLKHKDRVECLRASTLPAGVDASCTGDVIHRKLTHGDFLVMVTDGVLEYLHVKHPEEKLAEMIKEIKQRTQVLLLKS